MSVRGEMKNPAKYAKHTSRGCGQKKEMALRLPYTQLQEARKTFLEFNIALFLWNVKSL